jgi:hypothetical protein
MPELEPFDSRLTAAVHVFADRAQTSVDAAAVAERASRARRAGRLSWLGAVVPVPVPVVIVVALLVTALSLTLGVGALRNDHALVIPVPTPSPSAATPAATEPASPSPDAAHDGRADEVVTGIVILTVGIPYPQTQAGVVSHVRDGVITMTMQVSDPRVGGTGTWHVSADLGPTAGPEWGPYRLENAEGAWDGTCSGTAWNSDGGGDRGEGAAWSCWLTGSGAYDGYTTYLSATWSVPGPGDVRGVIYPAPPPAP